MEVNYLELLRRKYEYLDFDNVSVLDCFHAALQEVKGEASSDAITILNLEHYFLHYLILEIQKGNDTIKEAVLYGLDFKHEFFLRKRNDLARIVPKEKRFLCYEKAFDDTIRMYQTNDTRSFDSLLMENIIRIYKNYNIKQEDEIMAKHDLKLTSIYDVLPKYDQDLVELGVSLFNATRYEYLITRHYGTDLTGKNAVRNLSFQEKDRLDNALTALEERVEVMQTLRMDGLSFARIKGMFQGKDDGTIVSIMRSVNQSHKIEEKPHFRKKADLLNFFHITEKTLEEATLLISAQNARLAFKYTFGIGCNVMGRDSLLNMLEATDQEYEDLLVMVEKQLPGYIERVTGTNVMEKEKSLETKLSSQVKPHPLKEKVTIQKNKPVERKEVHQEEKPVLETKQIKKEVLSKHDVTDLSHEDTKVEVSNQNHFMKRAGRTRTTYFMDYFYQDGMSLEEKEKVSKIVFQIVEYLQEKQNSIFLIGKKLYGEDFLQPCTNIALTSSEQQLFKGFIREVRTSILAPKTLESYISNCDSKKLKEVLDYLKVHNSPLYAVGVKLFGSDFKEVNLPYKMSNEDSSSFRSFIKNVNKLMKKDLHQMDSTNSSHMYLDYFMDYIYDDTMSLEEKEKVKIRTLNILRIKSYNSKVSYEVAQKLYGIDLMQKKTSYQMKSEEKKNFFYLLKEVKDLALGNKKNTHQNVRKFNEYFYTLDMTDEDRNYIDSLIEQAIGSMNKDYQYYKVAQRLYDEDFKSDKNTDFRLTSTTAIQFSTFKNKVEEYILQVQGKEKEELSDEQASCINDYFMDYIYDDTMSLEEKEKVKIRTLNMLRVKAYSSKVAYEVVQKVYGIDLMQKKISYKLVGEEKRIFDHFWKDVRDVVLGEKKFRIYNAPTFYEYFYTLDMTDEDRKNMDQLVDQALLYLDKTTVYYKTTQELYGEDLKGFKNENIHVDQHLAYMRRSILAMMKKLQSKKTLYQASKLRKRKNRKRMIDYILKDKSIGLSKEEIELHFNDAILFAKEKSFSDYEAAVSMFGFDCKGQNNGVSLDSIQQQHFYHFIKNIKYYFKTLDVKDESIVLEVLPVVEESTLESTGEANVPNLDSTIKDNNTKEELSFMDQLIYHTYLTYHDSEFVKAKLRIDDDTLIHSYLNHFELYLEQDDILSYILLNHPDRIHDILSCPYFERLSIVLTEQEKEVIYLKLLARTNPNMTDDEISKITGIDLDTIGSYEIMTKSDVINSFNQYIKKK